MAGKQKDIGALWIKRSNKGEYLSGYIEIDGQKIPVVCFTNGYKKEEKHPDYHVYKSEPRMRTDAEDREYDRKADENLEELNNLPNNNTGDDNQDLYPDF